MKKNLTFFIKYLGPNDETVSRMLEAFTTTSIKNVRTQITKDIQQFKDKEIILIHHNQILEDDQTLEQLSQQGDVIILILPKIISINILYGKENQKRIDMDITIPIKETIDKYLKTQKIKKKINLLSYFALAYEKKLYPAISEKELKKKKLKQKKKKNITKYQICCLNLPLYAHKWWYSNFYLIRRLSLEDISIKNEEERQFLINQAQFAALSGLCAYKIEDWAELISFQFFFHNDDPNKNKVKIDEYTPFQIDCSPKLIQAKFKDISSSSHLENENKYIRKSILSGCQCSYIENVKMKWMRFWYKYKIYVSLMNVMIFSSNGKNFQYMKEISKIENVELQGANIYSSFCEKESNNEQINPIQTNESIKDDMENKPNIESYDQTNNLYLTNSSNNINNDNAISSDNNISENSFFFLNNNNDNTLLITIHFKDNTSWELSCDSQPAASRLKIVLDTMISQYRKNESNFLEKDVSLPNATNNNNATEEEELSEQLNILGERLGIFNPNENFDVSSQSIFNLPSDKKSETTQYPHYSVIITPEKVGEKAVFRGHNGYNKGNEFNFLKENIQKVKLLPSFEENILDNDSIINRNDPLLSNFFALGPNEQGNRNILILIILIFIIFHFIRRYFFHK